MKQNSKRKKFAFFTGSLADHCFFLTDDLFLYGFGRNKRGQLGVSNTKEHKTPVQVSNPHRVPKKRWKVSEVSLSTYHSVFLHRNGACYACGEGSEGELGVFSRALVWKLCDDVPQGMLEMSNFQQKYGQDSSNMKSVRSSSPPNNLFITKPSLVHLPKHVKIRNVVCGTRVSFFITSSNCVFYCGVLGSPNSLKESRSVQRFVPKKIDDFDGKIDSLTCGYQYTFFLLQNGSIYVVGRNEFGQSGGRALENVEGRDYEKPTLYNFFACKQLRVKSVDCGYYHSCFTTQDSRVYSCGFTYAGRLGLPEKVLKSSIMNGVNHPGLVDLKNVVDVKCGSHHTILWGNFRVKGKGGSNINKEKGLIALGCGYNGNRQIRNSCSTGANSLFKFGNFSHILTPVPVELPNSFVPVQVAAGGRRSFFIDKRGRLLLLGKNLLEGKKKGEVLDDVVTSRVVWVENGGPGCVIMEGYRIKEISRGFWDARGERMKFLVERISTLDCCLKIEMGPVKFCVPFMFNE